MKHQQMPLGQLRKLVGRALAGGARRRSMVLTEWDLHGDCRNPGAREIWSRPKSEVTRGSENPLGLIVTTRCRKCDECRAFRAGHWRKAAYTETAQAARTWFATLTIRPAERIAGLARARKRLASQGEDYDAQTFGEQFRLLHREFSKAITDMLKRIRKRSAAQVRYLLVAEAHKDGHPHYHMLVHEMRKDTVTYDILKDVWKLGYSRWKLSDPNSSRYICKYLTKSSAARVRASLRYGSVEKQEQNGLKPQSIIDVKKQ